MHSAAACYGGHGHLYAEDYRIVNLQLGGEKENDRILIYTSVALNCHVITCRS